MHQQLLLLFSILPYYLLAISLLSLTLLSFLIYLRFSILQRSRKIPHILLEITPPYDTKQSAYSTEQLYTTLATLKQSTSLTDSLFGAKRIHSLEIVATGKDGIRFLIRTNSRDAEIIKKNIYSFLPGVEIKEVPDYLPNTFGEFQNKLYQLHKLKLSNNFAYSLETQSTLKEHDPIAYITGHMTKLKDDECIALQVLITPVTPQSHKRESTLIKTIHWYLLNGRDISSFLRRKTLLSKEGLIIIAVSVIALALLYTAAFIDTTKLAPVLVFGLFGFVWWYLGYSPKATAKVTKTSPEKSEVYGKIGEKLGNTLFETAIRVYVSEGQDGGISHRVSGLLGTLISSTQTPYQSLKVSQERLLRRKISFIEKYSYLLLKNRFLPMQNDMILSASEIASLYHFPYTPTTKTEDIPLIKSPVLPLPLLMKSNKDQFAVTFAKNTYGNTELPIGLSIDERARHMYILGATGTGKSTLLLSLILQDIEQGNGCCIIDPHGDLIKAILARIPKHRAHDVFYFNPSDRDRPIGLNLLQKTPGLTKDEQETENDLITSNMLSIFSKLYPKRFWGPRMEHFLRNATLTALETENPTLITIHKLFLDYAYRKEVVEKLTDPVLKKFWLKDFAKMGSYQRSDAIAPIMNKISRFLTSPLTRHILGQKTSQLDFTQIMDNKKILLCDLSKGKIGEDTTTLLGALITAKIQLTALKRSYIDEEKRTDFYLYIDEFQNFTTEAFAQIMSEARKYHLYTILAHQTIAQIEDKDLIKVIMANVGTLISFRTSSVSDEAFILPNFTPEVKQGEIFNLPIYSFYMKLQAVIPQNTFSGQTIKQDNSTNTDIADDIIDKSRERYGTPREEIAQEIEKELKYLEEDEKKKKKTKKKPKLPDDESIIDDEK